MLSEVGTGGTWLPGKGSNLEWLIQSQLCYHYTTRQRGGNYAI